MDAREPIDAIDGLFRQGDLLFVLLPALPDTARPAAATDGPIIYLAGSSGSHTHTIAAQGVAVYTDPGDALVRYYVTPSPLVVSHSGLHAPARLTPAGCWACYRQTESTPDGLRVIQD